MKETQVMQKGSAVVKETGTAVRTCSSEDGNGTAKKRLCCEGDIDTAEWKSCIELDIGTVVRSSSSDKTQVLK
jgi:hypothetical protein